MVRVKHARSTPVAVLAIAAALLLSGCSGLLRDLTISDATPEELRSTLLQSSDLPDWSISPADVSSSAADRIVDRYQSDGEYCDTAGGVTGSYFSLEDYEGNILGVVSSAERVCGDVSDFIAITLENQQAYSEALSQVLSANLAEAGVAVQDYTRVQVQSGHGDGTVAFRITAKLSGPGGNAPYYGSEVWVYSDRIITTLYAEGYGTEIPTGEIERLVSLTKARHASL